MKGQSSLGLTSPKQKRNFNRKDLIILSELGKYLCPWFDS